MMRIKNSNPTSETDRVQDCKETKPNQSQSLIVLDMCLQSISLFCCVEYFMEFGTSFSKLKIMRKAMTYSTEKCGTNPDNRAH